MRSAGKRAEGPSRYEFEVQVDRLTTEGVNKMWTLGTAACKAEDREMTSDHSVCVGTVSGPLQESGRRREFVCWASDLCRL